MPLPLSSESDIDIVDNEIPSAAPVTLPTAELPKSLPEQAAAAVQLPLGRSSQNSSHPPFKSGTKPVLRPLKSNSTYIKLLRRPYQTANEREKVERGLRYITGSELPVQNAVYHVDFTQLEVEQIVNMVNAGYVTQPLNPTFDSLEELVQRQFHIPTIIGDRLKGRTGEDIRNFTTDILSGKAIKIDDQVRVLKLSAEGRNKPPVAKDHNTTCLQRNDARISSLLLARELEGGCMGYGRTRTRVNFQSEFKRCLEDSLQQVIQFSSCAGDIATISWVSDSTLVCGTTTHSDAHNQQYNKAGNLLLYSGLELRDPELHKIKIQEFEAQQLEREKLKPFLPELRKTGSESKPPSVHRTIPKLQAYPDHRIPRPRVMKGENSTHEMRQSQDPWLFSSVVSSDYDPVLNLAYTSSFDRTVKVWRVDGKSMECIATWHHDGNVNFVACAKDGSGRVATAADVPTEAVRIYSISDPNNISDEYVSFSCQRTDANLNDKWAYYPAAMKWGIASGCQHLLAVGYSPRSASGDDTDIPEEKHNSGEITIWGAEVDDRVLVDAAETANVFEICWHPKLPQFIAATSPCGIKGESSTRTQIHLFRKDSDRPDTYSGYQSLDCMACDINELTIMPNSLKHAYITAACTDGKVYIWDTATDGVPIHVLQHGVSLEGHDPEEVERLDTGVKFTAWGSTPDRFYTGGSDGEVKVWNIRNKRKPFIRTLLETPGPISSGAFSPDMSKLAIGDASGKLTIFSLDPEDAPEPQWKEVLVDNIVVAQSRKPVPFTPHDELEPPDGNSNDSDSEDFHAEDSMEDITASNAFNKINASIAANIFLNSNQLISTEIGVAQGPDYASTNLFCRSAHVNSDPNMPLLPRDERLQQECLRADRGAKRRSIQRLREPGLPETRHEATHYKNNTLSLPWVRSDTTWLEALESLGDLTVQDLYEKGDVLSLEEIDCGLVYEDES